MPFAIMKTWHPMIGLDRHIQTLPPPLAPVAGMQYFTRSVLFGISPIPTHKYCTTYLNSGFGATMVKGTDIGSLIPHTGPPSITLPLEIAFSGSKSYFGPSIHKVKDQNGDPGVICAALWVVANPNLNCGTPCPTPTGVVLAINTHFTEMTFADILAGVIQMAVDAAVQTALYFVGKGLDKLAGKLISKFAPKILTGHAAKALLKGVAQAEINVAKKAFIAAQATPAERAAFISLWSKVGDVAVNSILMNIGSPLGMSMTNITRTGLGPDHMTKSGLDRTPEGDVGDKQAAAVDNYLFGPDSADHGSGITDDPASAQHPDAGVDPPDASANVPTTKPGP